jgi:manganese/iron transport system substrate-binding protein
LEFTIIHSLGLSQCAKLLTICLLLLGAVGISHSAEKIKVATTFTVVADIVRNVTGDAAEVVSITRPGAEIHNYQPTPKDLLRVRDADIVFWNGLGLELWFEKFFRRLKGAEQVVLSEGVEELPITTGPYRNRPNPHAWMSPSDALIYVENIRAALVQYDADNAAVYNANAAAYSEQITALAAPLKEKILTVPAPSRWLASSEGAFSYLARDFGLREIYLWPINADAQGTPQQVKRMIDTVREHKIPAVFSESTVSDKAAKQVARETGARYGGVLYVDSLSEADGPVPTYLDLLRLTTETIVQGLTGD